MARSMGLDVIVRPLFELRPMSWSVDQPDSYDAVFITSSNALTLNNSSFSNLCKLPALCVGETTADAARRAGFVNLLIGDRGAAQLAEMAASKGYRHLLWLCGEPHGELSHPDLTFDVKITYQTPAIEWSADDRHCLERPLVALLHSPRAAQRFAGLVSDSRAIEIVAISEKAALAAGPGWAGVHWPATPTDDAMLALAAPLCRAD